MLQLTTLTTQIVIITINQRLASQLGQLCEMLTYHLYNLDDFRDQDTNLLNGVNLVIVDAVNTPEHVLEVKLRSVPSSIPILWIVPQESKSIEHQHVLYNPFSATKAINAIQAAMQTTASRMAKPAFEQPDALLHSLLKAKSPEEILESTAHYLVQHFDIQNVGVLHFLTEDTPQWLYWYREVEADEQNRLAAAVMTRKDLGKKWIRLTFSAGDAAQSNSVMILECDELPSRQQAVVMRDVVVMAAKVWQREYALAHTHEQISGLQAFEMLSRSIVGELDGQQVMHNIVNSARMIVRAQGSVLWLRRKHRLIAVAQVGSPQLKMKEVLIGEHPITDVLQQEKPVIFSGFNDDRLFPPGTIFQSLVVPLIDQDSTIGIIQTINAEDNRLFVQQDQWRLRNLASWSVIAIKNADLHQQAHSAFQRERTYRNRLIQTEKLTALGQLVASVAHEINNPLQIAQSCVDIMSLKTEDESMVKNLNVLQDCIDQIGSVLQRVRSNYQVPEQYPKLLDINELIKQTARMAAPNVDKKGVELRLELADDLPDINCFEHEMRQVFLNLIQNAVDAMHNEAGRIEIRTRFIEEIEMVSIIVKDNGPGIPPEMVNMVFETFFTTKSGGSGLGLAICKDIIVQHGGNIDVASEPGQGASFLIQLPIY